MADLETLRTLRPGLLTDEEFLQVRAYNYRRLPDDRFGLLEFMGMSPAEYAAWFLEGVIPERLMRVDGRRTRCDRCGAVPAFHRAAEVCPTCGDVPLCAGCLAAHRAEVADGEV